MSAPDVWTVLRVLVAGALAAALTGIVRRYAIRRAVMDVPNERSSHEQPTPRGGGLGIVLAVSAAVAWGAAAGMVERRLAAVLVLGGGAVAAIGWIDDHRPLSARVRLLVHVVAALGGVLALGGLPALHVGDGVWAIGPLGTAMAALGVVWLTNLYNFMDGIDGLAGGEAVLVGLAGGALLHGTGAVGLAECAWIVAAASAGFLAWNWPPARIFMGDVGSGYLGYLFGMLAVASERDGRVPALAWLVLLGVFVVDATVTLARRGLRGSDVTTAHRSHAYQRLARSAGSHRRSTLGALGLGLPLAALAAVIVHHPRLWAAAAILAVAALATAYGLVERRSPM